MFLCVALLLQSYKYNFKHCAHENMLLGKLFRANSALKDIQRVELLWVTIQIKCYPVSDQFEGVSDTPTLHRGLSYLKEGFYNHGHFSQGHFYILLL